MQNDVTVIIHLVKDVRRKPMVCGTVLISCQMQGTASKAPRVKFSDLLVLGAAMFLVVTSSCHLNLKTASHIHSILLSRDIIYFTIG